jgi:hypothetical protein
MGRRGGWARWRGSEIQMKTRTWHVLVVFWVLSVSVSACIQERTRREKERIRVDYTARRDRLWAISDTQIQVLRGFTRQIKTTTRRINTGHDNARLRPCR